MSLVGGRLKANLVLKIGGYIHVFDSNVSIESCHLFGSAINIATNIPKITSTTSHTYCIMWTSTDVPSLQPNTDHRPYSPRVFYLTAMPQRILYSRLVADAI